MSAIASATVPAAVTSETPAASIQRAEPKNASYQRSESAVGGNRNRLESLNDIGTMIRQGRIR